jgi:hypothetical protein
MKKEEENILRGAAIKIYSELEKLKNLEDYLDSMQTQVKFTKLEKEREYRTALQRLVFDKREK